MKKTIVTIILGVSCCTAVSATDFATKMLDSTFKLFHPNSTGTCFLVRREAPDNNLYMVTAAHVLERTKADTAIIVLREHRADGSYQRHDHTIDIRRDGKPLWARHNSEDTAVLRLAAPLPVPVSVLDLSDIADEDRFIASGLRICSPIFILTYPQRVEANKAGFAIARQSIIASLPLLPLDKHRTYMADFTTFSGDSGGPAFIPGTDGNPLLVGIVLAEIRHDEQVKSHYEEHTIHHPLGIATVLHAKFVLETIESAAKQSAAQPK
jgi:hypothetical protein